MHLGNLSQPRRRAFRRNVALRIAQHEFLHRGGTQQRRKVVRVKMPFRMCLAIGWTLVKTHGIRERRLEKIVIANSYAPQDVREKLRFFTRKFGKRSEM